MFTSLTDKMAAIVARIKARFARKPGPKRMAEGGDLYTTKKTAGEIALDVTSTVLDVTILTLTAVVLVAAALVTPVVTMVPTYSYSWLFGPTLTYRPFYI